MADTDPTTETETEIEIETEIESRIEREHGADDDPFRAYLTERIEVERAQLEVAPSERRRFHRVRLDAFEQVRGHYDLHRHELVETDPPAGESSGG